MKKIGGAAIPSMACLTGNKRNLVVRRHLYSWLHTYSCENLETEHKIQDFQFLIKKNIIELTDDSN